jgi:phosphoribosylanthranilate isomerase
MFQIKICGITNEEDARLAAKAGADALGLNFYPKSPRFISQETARRIIDILPPTVLKVGLFVNESVEAVIKSFDSLGLDLIQLHGDESPQYILQLGNRPVMKAFRLSSAGLSPIEAYLEELCRTDFQSVQEKGQIRNLSYVLLDSHVEGVYGGTGTPADWVVCAEYARNPNYPPLVLAGGLTPENIAKAVREVRPAAVDTASGVEISPGLKDPHRLTTFIENARRGFLSKNA